MSHARRWPFFIGGGAACGGWARWLARWQAGACQYCYDVYTYYNTRTRSSRNNTGAVSILTHPSATRAAPLRNARAALCVVGA